LRPAITERTGRQGWRAAMATMMLLGCPAMGMAMTVQQAVDAGLAIHPQVRAALAEAERAGTEIKIAKAGYYPALQVSGGPQAGDIGEMVYDVTLSQRLFDWGRVAGGVEGATANQRKLGAALEVTRDDAALDIVETYLDVLVAERRVAAVRGFLERLQGIRGMTEARSGSGYADRTELDRANLETARGQEQLALEEGALADARNQLRILVGTEPGVLQDPEPASMAARLAGAGMEPAIERSPLLRRSAEDVSVAEAELRQAKAALLPQLNLEASALRREIGGQLQNDSVVSLRFRMDVMQGFSNFQRPTAARQRIESAHWTADATRRDLRRQLQTLFDTAQTLRWREESLQQQVGESEQVGVLYRDQFEVGRRDIIDLLSVQRERLEAERQLITLHMERKRMEYRAAAQVGLLGPLLEDRLDADSAQ